MNLARPSDPRSPIPTVNFHCWKPCNMRCRHCFARYDDAGHDSLQRDDGLAVVAELTKGFDRINFAGGEPTLCPWLTQALDLARASGAATSIVTNGWSLAKKPALRDAVLNRVDLVGLSVDSATAAANQLIGRVVGRHDLPLDELVALTEQVRATRIQLKLNTVVQRANLHEDFHTLVRRLRPDRWKVLRVLPVRGQNDADYQDLAISELEFADFVARHADLAGDGIVMVPEDHDAMTGSYAMVDPGGYAYDNVDGAHHYSSAPVHHCGWAAAFNEVRLMRDRFLARGGDYALEGGAR